MSADRLSCTRGKGSLGINEKAVSSEVIPALRGIK